jgi:hypothetical protein
MMWGGSWGAKLKVELQATAESCEELYAKFWQVDLEFGTTAGRYLITYSYQFEGERHIATIESAFPYKAGEVFDVLVASRDPYRSVPSVMETCWKGKPVRWSIAAIVAVAALYLAMHFHLQDP